MLHRFCHDFASKIICLTVPKNAVGESFSLSLISGIEKVWMKGGGEVSSIAVEFFCLTVPKRFLGEPFSVSIILDTEKVWMRRWGGGGVYQDFPSKIFCLTLAKNFDGQPFSVSLISGTEKFYASEGYVTSFCRNFFVSQYRKIS